MENATLYKATLLDMLQSGKSLNALCDYIETNTGCPTAICLATETIIATSKGYSQDLIREYVSSPKKYDANDMLNSEKMLDMVYADCKPHLVYFPYLHDRRVLCGCVCDGERIGILDIVVSGENPTKEQMDLIDLIASHLALFMRANGFLIDTGRNLSVQNLIIGIINGTVEEGKQRLHADNSRFFGIENWRIVWITGNRRTKEASRTSREHRSELLAGICRGEYGCWTVAYTTQKEDGDIVLLDDMFSDKVRKLEEFCIQHGCKANVSRSFSRLMDMPEVFEELKFMDLFFSGTENEPVMRCYDDYRISMAVADLYFNGNIDLIQSPLLDKIRKYDKEHGTDYFSTLEAFFDCHADNKEIAKKLFVHTNTAMYRIRRLSELFGIDFGNYRVMSDLYYTLMLRGLAERLAKTENET